MCSKQKRALNFCAQNSKKQQLKLHKKQPYRNRSLIKALISIGLLSFLIYGVEFGYFPTTPFYFAELSFLAMCRCLYSFGEMPRRALKMDKKLDKELKPEEKQASLTENPFRSRVQA